MSAPNFYDVLGVSHDADPATIKAAYRRKAKDAHPDKGGDDAQRALINQAHECLMDPARREIYDRTGADSTASPQEDEARAILIDAFNFLLLQGPEHGLMLALEERICQGMRKIEAEKSQAVAARGRFAKRRATITRKEGHNLFHQLVDDQISKINQAIARMDAAVAIHQRALEMLREYSSVEEMMTPSSAQEQWQQQYQNQRPGFFFPGFIP